MNQKEILKWQIEMGADEAIENIPQNQFEIAAKKPEKKILEPAPTMPPTKHIANTAPPASPKNAAIKARKLADSCKTLKELRDVVENFEGLSIKKTATNTVFADGNPDSEIMFIGEAPGAQEDIEGIPFCGQSGQLLDKMLGWVGLTREKNYYISNTIFWRPPGNRKPTPEETATCQAFVEKHIALINPKMLILVGGTATSAVLGQKTGISKLRGKYHEYTNPYLKKPIVVGVIFHPAYLLRSPGQKRHAWHDLLSIKHKLAEL
jgi:DNA polymerase